MNRLVKFALALSCFLPLFFIFGVENLCAALHHFSAMKNVEQTPELLLCHSRGLYFNAALTVVWLILFIAGICGIIHFRRTFLNSRTSAKETVILTKAENITADYYFTYFSLFVISFFSVDPTKLKDVLIIFFLMVLIIWVYITNDMYFINPVLNLLGYRSFSITYHKSTAQTAMDPVPDSFEIKVFAKEHLERMRGKKFFITFSPHYFSVCYPVPEDTQNGK